MNKISPFFWFDFQAEDAAMFYVDLFNGNPGRKKRSKIGAVLRYDKNAAKASGQPEGSVLTIAFTLEGQDFTALNGGKPEGFETNLTNAISFVVECKTQKEIDYFWDKLGDSGETGQCGWINHDKFGITWQIVPSSLSKYIGGKDPKGAARAMQAMLGMTKFDIAELKKAYLGK